MIISVCVCTYKRLEWLGFLLKSLLSQKTKGLFSYEIVVVDNDAAGSAEPLVKQIKESQSEISISYHVQPQKNIALARNTAVQNAAGQWLAFIDDDEYPDPQWLLHLFNSLNESGFDGVLGPVLPIFDVEPEEWIKKGRFFERENLPAGTNLLWNETRCGNVLIRSKIFKDEKIYFNSQFGHCGGEDSDFFKRAMEKGFCFGWSRESVVYEHVPEKRCSLKYIIDRGMRTATNYSMIALEDKKIGQKILFLAKAMISVIFRMLVWPIACLFGLPGIVKNLNELCRNAAKANYCLRSMHPAAH